MPVNFFTPAGPGSITDPYYRIRNDRGFFKMTGQTRDDTLPFWTMIDDPIGSPDDEGTYCAWALSDGYLIDISTAIKPTPTWPSNALINYIKVHYRGTSGYDSNGNPIEPPSGAGNTFAYGFRSGNPRVNYYQSMTFSLGAIATYSKTFYTKDGTNYGTDGTVPFIGSDLVNLELYGPRYNYYWVTDDKGLSKNDNGHNTMTQMYMEVSWDFPKNFGPSSLLLV